MHAQPLIFGKCVDGETEYRIYSTDGRGETPINGMFKNTDGWNATTWTAEGHYYISNPSDLDIPPADIAQLFSGVIDTPEAGK